MGKISCPLSPVTIRLDAQFGTPYPRSAGFDTDSVAKPAGCTTHLHQQGIQDPREGPSFARRTTQDLLWSSLTRQAHQERRYHGGAKPQEALVT